MSEGAILAWFRQDLRLADNPALHAAASEGVPVIPIFILDEEGPGEWRLGGASKVWLDGSLRVLMESLESVKSRLTIRRGNPLETLVKLAKETGANRVYCNQRYEPWAVKQQAALAENLSKQGVQLVSHKGGTLLFDLDGVKTGQGKPYQVFTPYFKKCLTTLPTLDVLPAPKSLKAPKAWPDLLSVDDLALRSSIGWDREMVDFWQPGEAEAQKLLKSFIAKKQDGYAEARNIPAVDGTSRLSPYLAHGEISPRQIWAEVMEDGKRSGSTFLREIAWREFAYHVLHHFPQTTHEALKPKFNRLPWELRAECFDRWAQGQTGYPIVDAGMRQLWRVGWMHNRVRMIVGSFLTKDLLISWQDGTRWFWDTLVDADLAQNSLNWQWVAGCGADAQPFFRIFNPVSQGKKFDSQGAYIRQWVPELAHLPAKYIHEPWHAPEAVLQKAGVTLGKQYPHPIVDHGEARDKALMLYRKTVAGKA